MPDKAITKDMPIGDVVKTYPETIPVFFKYGLHCIGCHVAAWESIAEGAAVHGVLEIDQMVEELNKAIEGGKRGEEESQEAGRT